MALLLVLLPTILAFSLASTDQCVSSPGSSIDLTLRSHKNASGHWIITVDTRRLRRKDNPREFSVNVQHKSSIVGSCEIEEHVSMAFVYPSLHDTLMPGAIEPSSNGPTTTTAATPSVATATSPKSCPHSGYTLFQNFNCYKAFSSKGERKTWSEARDQCMRDGGDLMVVDNERERKEVYVPLYNSVDWRYLAPWMGVYMPQAGDGWTSVKGEPALSSWWRPGDPDGNAALQCAFADFTGLLVNDNCEGARPFICEIAL